MATTVLLADDSITIQKVVGIIFANEDYELVVVDNGNDALAKAREIRPSVMLVDALMPDRSGYEVCAEIRRDPVLKDTPLLLLVGAFEPFEEESARTSGIDDHITKPFESQNLLEKVHALLDLGATRATAPVFPETVTPSRAEAPLVEEPGASAAVSANLIEPFRNFIHLGADETHAETPVESAPPRETLSSAAVEPGAESIIVLSSVDIVEAGPDDDPWGAFEEDGQVCYGEVFEEGQPGFPDLVEEVEPVSLQDEQEEIAEIRIGEPLPADETPVCDEFGTPAAAEQPALADRTETAAFSGFSPLGSPGAATFSAERIDLGDMPAETVFSPEPEAAGAQSRPDDSLDDAKAVMSEPEFGFAPDEAYLPVAESRVEAEPAPEVAIPAGEAAQITLSEEQLSAVVSRISREVIEKIAWDVVPDLAETIIREEIRKIKERIGR
jgi:CheY-like chemotaxis protein